LLIIIRNDYIFGWLVDYELYLGALVDYEDYFPLKLFNNQLP